MYNILVVDDEKMHRKGILSLLEEFCPEDMLWEAADGTEAMEIMQNMPCEIVISDIRMARMDGLSLLREVKNIRPEVSFIIISGYADFAYAREAIAFQASAYLLKPVDKAELEKTITEVKRKYRGNEETKYRVSSLEERLRETVPVYMEWLLNQYITCSRVQSREQLDGFWPMRQSGFIILTKIRKKSRLEEEERREIGYVIKKSMEPASAVTFSVNHLYNTLATLVLAPERPAEKTLRNIVYLLEAREKTTADNIYFAVSLLHEDMSLRGVESFSEAACALKYAFYGDRHILWAEDYPENTREETVWNGEELVDALRQGKTEQADRLYNRLLEKGIPGNWISPEIMKRKVVFLFFRILRTLEPFMEKDAVPKLNEKDGRIMETEWYDDLLSEGRLLLFQIGRSIERQKLSGQINPVQRCKDYLEKNYKEEISLETVAGEFHFNPSYLSTLFKQSFGTSFSEYLSEVRMRKALDLLLHSDCRVKQIAGMVGYKDSNYFIRSFKKKYKVTPDEFRKRGKNSVPPKGEEET